MDVKEAGTFISIGLRRWAGIIGALMLLPVPGSAQTDPEPVTGATVMPPTELIAGRLDRLMQAYHDHDLFNGSVLIARGGQDLLRKSYGKADREWDIDAAPNTRFRIGSINKQFTAMVIMQLVQEGRLGLSDTLSDHLPWFAPNVAERITIHHLLTHTSGLFNYTDEEHFPTEMASSYLEPEDFAKHYFRDTMLFAPGTDIRYCNTGYYLLGLIIERIESKPYEQVLQARIFDVLGMNDSGVEAPGVLIPRMAEGYEFDLDGYSPTGYINMRSATFSAGAMYSTVEDLKRWDDALYTDRLLTAENKRIMFTPFRPNYAYGIAVVKRKNYLGLGRDVTEMLHGGGIHGFSSQMTRFPEDRILVVLLDNSRAGTRGTELEGIAAELMRVVHGLPCEPVKPLAGRVLYQRMDTTSVDDALRFFKEELSTHRERYHFGAFEQDLNSIGYTYLQRGRIADALAVFTLATQEFPRSANAFDSLGEAHFTAGRYKEATDHYKRSLELDPTNTNASEMIERMAAER